MFRRSYEILHDTCVTPCHTFWKGLLLLSAHPLEFRIFNLGSLANLKFGYLFCVLTMLLLFALAKSIEISKYICLRRQILLSIPDKILGRLQPT